MRILILNLWLILCVAAVAAGSSVTFPPRLNVVTRKEWDAKPPVSEMVRHKPEFITIHHTGTKQNPARSLEDKMRGLQAFSQREDKLASGKSKAAWPDVPYHFYIAVDGRVAEGRELNYVGDTNTEYDPTGHLLVTLEGNFQNEQPTDEQMKSARRLVRYLAKRFKVPVEKIKTHQDYAKTACPGKNLQDRMNEIRAAAKTEE